MGAQVLPWNHGAATEPPSQLIRGRGMSTRKDLPEVPLPALPGFGEGAGEPRAALRTATASSFSLPALAWAASALSGKEGQGILRLMEALGAGSSP